MKPRFLAIAFLATASLASAAMIDVPQNRQEFVQAVSEGRGATTVETFTSDQSLDSIYAVLQEKVGVCLDQKVERTAYVGYVERSSSDYNPTLRRVAKDRAEFTLQVQHNPRGVGHNPPVGGLYFMAADLKAVDANRTEIVFYRSTMGVKKIVASLKDWFAAEPAPCPKLR